VPSVHVIQWPIANAMTIGANKPTVLLQSSIIGMLDRRQLDAVLAHEAGHVPSEHVRYRTTLEILPPVTDDLMYTGHLEHQKRRD
jgi:Zn-dependent protease with chaperone function